MGLDITVMIADWSWLAEVPPPERLSRLRDAWYDDETGLWDHDAPAVEGDWVWPRGPHGAHFAVYEFLHTCGSFKAHFWAGQRWEAVREHVEPALRTEVDGFLPGLIWDGPDAASRVSSVTVPLPTAFCSPGHRQACGNWPWPGSGSGPASPSCEDPSPSTPPSPKAGSVTSTRSGDC
ncbi:hypothetical protein [Streptomyces pharetrae]|uniref:hypothetical protein n=1 Tax=Streptomyces pharetrae TaxID=291370 RepID=UPI00268A6412